MADEENKGKEENKEANEPPLSYGSGINRMVFFNSFEEQEEYTAKVAAALTPLECMQHMRKLINLSYRMDGIDFNNPPTQHSITFS